MKYIEIYTNIRYSHEYRSYLKMDINFKVHQLQKKNDY